MSFWKDYIWKRPRRACDPFEFIKFIPYLASVHTKPGGNGVEVEFHWDGKTKHIDIHNTCLSLSLTTQQCEDVGRMFFEASLHARITQRDKNEQ